MLIDTHTHLESFARHGALPSILSRAREAGVEAMITIGTSTDDWGLYRTLAKENLGWIHYSVGIHPCSVEENWRNQFDRVEDFFSASTSEPRPVGVGEIGLDRFHLPKNDLSAAEKIFAWQQDAFRAGLALGKRLGCPIVVHSRGAFHECVKLIDESGVDWTKVVFHCFTEGETEMKVLRNRGGVGSFTGILTYKNADLVRAAASVQGLDFFMVETDAPYLTPMPHRGKPNEPAFVRHTAEFAAQMFGVTFETLAKRSTENARRFYQL